jgi:hypothetical protein
MGVIRFGPGVLLTVLGLGLWVVDTGFAVGGPRLPTSALGVVAWICLLVGVGLLKLATR